MKQAKVDLQFIESDNIVKAILDLIPALNITKLVLGTTKLRYMQLISKYTIITNLDP
jgi:K+-sensing histidine kinase KdpD